MLIHIKLKRWFLDLFRYPAYHRADSSYDTYWRQRNMRAVLNSFQAERVRLLAERIAPGDSVLDIGCGDGRILRELSKKVSGLTIVGLDSSEAALKEAKRNGVEALYTDIMQPHAFDRVGTYDWVLLLEVLEHMPNPEELLGLVRTHARRGVVFSVPNTGFFVHRLRLLLGRFPLQWKAHPGEHLRFWTLRDMRWWMDQLGYPYEIYTYEGVPLLNRVWPSLFAAGLLIVVSK